MFNAAQSAVNTTGLAGIQWSIFLLIHHDRGNWLNGKYPHGWHLFPTTRNKCKANAYGVCVELHWYMLKHSNILAALKYWHSTHLRDMPRSWLTTVHKYSLITFLNPCWRMVSIGPYIVPSIRSYCILIKLNFVYRGPVDNKSSLVKEIWLVPTRRPLHEPMLTHFTVAYKLEQASMC